MAIDEGSINLRELVPGQYERGPTRIQAVRWVPDQNDDELVRFTSGRFRHELYAQGEVYNESHDDWNRVKPYDWVIRGIKGEFYPCERHVFAETYTSAVPRGDMLALNAVPRHQLTGLPKEVNDALSLWITTSRGQGSHGVGSFLVALQERGLGVFPVVDRST